MIDVNLKSPVIIKLLCRWFASKTPKLNDGTLSNGITNTIFCSFPYSLIELHWKVHSGIQKSNLRREASHTTLCIALLFALCYLPSGFLRFFFFLDHMGKLQYTDEPHNISWWFWKSKRTPIHLRRPLKVKWLPSLIQTPDLRGHSSIGMHWPLH